MKSLSISVPYHSSSPSLKTRNTCSSNVLNTKKRDCKLQLNQVEKESIKSINDFKNALTCISRTREIASFLKKCHNIRFPEDDIAAKKKSMENRSRNKKPSEGNRRQQRRTDKICSMITSYHWVDNGHAS